jgi:hypothetical protein
VELVAATRTADGAVEVTLGDGTGLTTLTGSPLEIAALCDAMEQAAVLAGASPRSAWLADLRAGDAVIRVGIARGRVRFVVGPAG